MSRTPAVLVCVLALAGCGHTSRAQPALGAGHAPAARSAAQLATCFATPIGQGHIGACTPRAQLPPPPFPTARQAGLQICDTYNGDPITNFHAVVRAGVRGCWFKAIEGSSFTDQAFVSQVRGARLVGLPAGGYDFVRTYSAGEAQRFVSRLKATGTCTGRNVLPPALDIEAGNATRGGVQTMVNVVRHACGKVSAYTGPWYWNPYLGHWWPRGVLAWVSGYPNISGSVGSPRVDFHQYTDRGSNGDHTGDMSVFCCSPAQYAQAISGRPPNPRLLALQAELVRDVSRLRHLQRVLPGLRRRYARSRHPGRYIGTVHAIRHVEARVRRVRAEIKRLSR